MLCLAMNVKYVQFSTQIMRRLKNNIDELVLRFLKDGFMHLSLQIWKWILISGISYCGIF